MTESATTTSNYYYVYYDCPFRNVCSDNGKKCEFCKHNPKRSYYELAEPYYPYIPYIPCYPPYYPYWTTTTIGDATTTTYYTST